MSNAIQNRYEFVYLFDVRNGNPNGDPDAGNLPRIDPETSKGLVTDVCIKRKVRNYVEITRGNAPPFEIYVKEKAVLSRQHKRAHDALPAELADADKVTQARAWMCQNFYDVRAFGAVMSLKEFNCGQVRGPVQIAFAESLDAIIPLEVSITRMAVATEREAEDQKGDNRTMGRKSIVPYGLYRAHGFISAHLAEQTGFSEDDVGLCWEALQFMFDHDRSAARGMMAPRGLIVFRHDSKLGNAPAHKLFERVHIERRNGDQPPRSFEDYAVRVEETGLPGGVTVQQLV